MSRFVIIAGVVCVCSAYAAPSAWLGEQTANFHQVAGPFVSTDYGFRINPPSQAIEYVTNGGDGNHGPILILGEGREMVVYPQYTGFAPGDDTPCGAEPTKWEATSKKTASVAHLDGRNACMLTYTQENAVERVIQATGNDRGTGIMYTLLLTTTAQYARTDFQSFEQMARSFKRVPISP